VLESCRALARTSGSHKPYVTFYESLEGWEESESVRRITCPKLTYVGSADLIEREGVRMETAATLRAHRQELVSCGWQVCEIPGRDHSLWTDPGTVVPIVRPFLDTVAESSALTS
jgi:hypothetical protein